MKMAPIYSINGRLLGHLNMDECGESRFCVTVTDMSQSLKSLPSSDEVKLRGDTVRFHNVPLRTMRFRSGTDEQTVCYLVADGLPAWFWDAYATVKFSSDHWNN